MIPELGFSVRSPFGSLGDGVAGGVEKLLLGDDWPPPTRITSPDTEDKSSKAKNIPELNVWGAKCALTDILRWESR